MNDASYDLTTKLSDANAGVKRIRLFVLIELIATLAALALILPVGSDYEVRAALIICSVNGGLCFFTYLLRRSAQVEWIVYANLAMVALMLALSGPISGKVDGSVWVLFQIPPLIATIVLNSPRATVTVSLTTAIIMSIVIGMEVAGALPVELIIPKGSLLVNFGNQLLTLGVVAITIRLLVSRSRRLLVEAQEARQRVEHQLEHERTLIAQTESANRDLAASLTALQQREEQLRAEQAQAARLRGLISELSTPVIPILEGVVIMPLVGDLDGRRGRDLTSALLRGVSHYNARIVILDVTGVPTIDSALGGELLRAADGVRLLGTEPILAGIRPEVAQTLVSLGLDFLSFRTVADLQTGVRYALGGHVTT